MRILAIEGALARCSAAVLADGEIVASAMEDAARGHPSLLPSMAQAVLARAGLRATALDAVAVGVGPGGFTGLRAAIALAEGIARGAGIPLVGVTTGEALAAALPGDGRVVWAAVDNRRGRVVLECFAAGTAVPRAPLVAPLDDLPRVDGPVLVLGDAAVAVAEILAARGATVEARPGLPEAAAVARVAARRLAGALPPRDGTPIYAEPPAVRAPA
ncbi:tRNA (adenosine(37)-N6)-threonylcarbamoyltransferase complex dimerization subunit type 1 TsaB [Neoroseomonas oryzicola]|uniref:tRNA (Adenosine(37)-N6)-threonylcarbamoyltransferase complex dimerization subunit type 1 TsaB n=3 Tax=Neoroseomonas oryzicola TaxID=535904 RepID=A0ABX1EGW1_9PROT|nr:tRNA (adenosine(37)-N6)-threonylcarbamoyltransferase complex dimerization subunit type 1 TsaB [Neoroseomonas oryzicola]NKE16869.1 tRNA (adenosine(37)-N6)-threonylcarbamoyltransferase complex dimerization subunit type 1 TsaB [Neoroseomonas oryzicola]